MITIICTTNRLNALSKELSHYYQKLLKDLGEESELIDLADLPSDFVVTALYENSGKNLEFNPFREKMKKAEKMVFIVPEYNGSFPGVLKAFIDGLEYPDTFKGKKCALVGLSSGSQGAGLALSHLTDIFNYRGMHVLALKPRLAQIGQYFKEGKMNNDFYHEMLEEQAKELISF